MVEEGLRQRAQEQFLIRAMLQPLDAGKVKAGAVMSASSTQPISSVCARAARMMAPASPFSVTALLDHDSVAPAIPTNETRRSRKSSKVGDTEASKSGRL